jgi:hypothetical protein
MYFIVLYYVSNVTGMSSINLQFSVMFLLMFQCLYVFAIFRALCGVIACIGLKYRQKSLLNKTSNMFSD